jgi:hypothetical protein
VTAEEDEEEDEESGPLSTVQQEFAAFQSACVAAAVSRVAAAVSIQRAVRRRRWGGRQRGQGLTSRLAGAAAGKAKTAGASGALPTEAQAVAAERRAVGAETSGAGAASVASGGSMQATSATVTMAVGDGMAIDMAEEMRRYRVSKLGSSWSGGGPGRDGGRGRVREPVEVRGVKREVPSAVRRASGSSGFCRVLAGGWVEVVFEAAGSLGLQFDQTTWPRLYGVKARSLASAFAPALCAGLLLAEVNGRHAATRPMEEVSKTGRPAQLTKTPVRLPKLTSTPSPTVVWLRCGRRCSARSGPFASSSPPPSRCAMRKSTCKSTHTYMYVVSPAATDGGEEPFYAPLAALPLPPAAAARLSVEPLYLCRHRYRLTGLKFPYIYIFFDPIISTRTMHDKN